MKLKLDILKTLNALLDQEDTDGDKKLTIEDKGPKSFVLTDAKGKKKVTIEGIFHLSNLLQELILAKEKNSDTIFEEPINRFTRMIEDYYWDGLTRSIDKKGLINVLSDENHRLINNECMFLIIIQQRSLILKN